MSQPQDSHSKRRCDQDNSWVSGQIKVLPFSVSTMGKVFLKSLYFLSIHQAGIYELNDMTHIRILCVCLGVDGRCVRAG